MTQAVVYVLFGAFVLAATVDGLIWFYRARRHSERLEDIRRRVRF